MHTTIHPSHLPPGSIAPTHLLKDAQVDEIPSSEELVLVEHDGVLRVVRNPAFTLPSAAVVPAITFQPPISVAATAIASETPMSIDAEVSEPSTSSQAVRRQLRPAGSSTGSGKSASFIESEQFQKLFDEVFTHDPDSLAGGTDVEDTDVEDESQVQAHSQAKQRRQESRVWEAQLKNKLADPSVGPDELMRLAAQFDERNVSIEKILGLRCQVLEGDLAESRHAISDFNSRLSSMSALHASQAASLTQTHELEVANYRRQAQALQKKLHLVERGYNGHSSVGPWKGEDSAHPYTSHSEAALLLENRILKGDKKHLKRRLQDSEARTDRLEQELKRLRAIFLNGAPLIAVDSNLVLDVPRHEAPLTPEAEEELRLSISAPKWNKKAVTMGDAESEHLLLAGQRLSHVRRINRVPLSAKIVQKAEEIVNTVQGNPGLLSILSKDAHTREFYGQKLPSPVAIKKRSASEAGLALQADITPPRRSGTPPPIAGSSRGPFGSPKPPTTPRQKSAASKFKDKGPLSPGREASADGAPPSGGSEHAGAMLALFSAASSVLTPEQSGGASEDVEMDLGAAQGSPTPRKSTGAAKASTSASTTAAAAAQKKGKGKGKRKEAGDDSLNALNVLADQATAHGPEDGQSSNGVTFALQEDETEQDEDGDPDYAAPKPKRRRTPSSKGTNGKVAAATTTTAESKKPRAQYLKWTPKEDEDLVKAVIKWGQRWDAVAQEVPSRSYHQCRQRWLRGLKSGENLPPELEHLGEEARYAVREYLTNRGAGKAGASGGGGVYLHPRSGAEDDEDDEDDDGEEEDQQLPPLPSTSAYARQGAGESMASLLATHRGASMS